ncbi:MAG: hypothetical protein IJK89_09265 [Clostridia bacterium]|nr:hypothetical protein [Clostridia bacterium]
MKYGKLSVALLALAVLIQLAVPCAFILEKNTILDKGTTYRIRVNWIDFEDDLLELKYDISNNWDTDEMRYATPENEYDGIYQSLRLTKERTDSDACMKSASVREFRSPIGEYAFPDVKHEHAYQTYIDLYDNGRYFYAAIVVYHGKALLTGVYLDDGTPVETVFQ